MDFELNDEHLQLQRAMRDFAETPIRPVAREYEQARRYTQIVERMKEMGLDGLAIEPIAGPDEIQRNIVGERILGLPREPAVDREVPFSELANGIQRNQLAEHVLGLPH